MEREIHSILGPLGVKEPLSRLVAEDLRTVEEDVWGERMEGAEGVVTATAGGRSRSTRSGSGSGSQDEVKRKNWLGWKRKMGE